MKKLSLLVLFVSWAVLSQTPDLLGIASYGGYNANGFIYSIYNGNIQHIHDFVSVDQKGKYPRNALVEYNGLYYGVANGGAHAVGVIFSYDATTHQVTDLYHFDRSSGYFPSSVLTVYDDKLYGATAKGGAADAGTIFSFDPASGDFQTLYELTGTSQGHRIMGFVANNDVLYGVTKFGGNNNNDGVLFSFDLTTNIYSVLHDFTYSSAGKVARFTIPIFYNNALYGVLYYGSRLYKYDLSTGSLSILHTFSSSTGYYPTGRLVLDGGIIYGLTKRGGTHNHGSIYRYDIDNDNMSDIYQFVSIEPELGGFIKTGNLLVGISNYYSSSINGGIYTFDLGTNTINNYGTFIGYGTNYNYLTPLGNNKFIGIRNYAGSNFNGEIFEADLTANSIQTTFNFNLSPNGSVPWGRMELASNGKIYGVTRGGGQHGSGIVFEIDQNANFQKIFECTQNRYSTLHKVTIYNDKIYFIGYDKIISIDVNTHQSNIEATLPVYANVPLLLASNGKMYTVISDDRMIEFDPVTGSYSQYSTTGLEYASGELTEYNAKIYYTVDYSENNYNGVFYGALVSFDTNTKTFQVEKDFDDISGMSYYFYNSKNALTVLNNKLYGATSSGGAYGEGTLYELNPATGNFTVLQDVVYHNFFGQKFLPVGNYTLLGTYGDKIVAYNLQNNTQQVVKDLSPEVYSSFASLIDLSGSSVESEILTHFSIYPNPAVDFVNVISLDDKYAVDKINLIGVDGKVHITTGKTDRIDVSRLSKGVYILQILLKNGSRVKQLILKE